MRSKNYVITGFKRIIQNLKARIDIITFPPTVFTFLSKFVKI